MRHNRLIFSVLLSSTLLFGGIQSTHAQCNVTGGTSPDDTVFCFNVGSDGIDTGNDTVTITADAHVLDAILKDGGTSIVNILGTQNSGTNGVSVTDMSEVFSAGDITATPA